VNTSITDETDFNKKIHTVYISRFTFHVSRFTKRMDELIAYNKARWEELSGANVIFARPWLELDKTSARRNVDPEGILDKIAGKDVLCLAGGGGQQSVAFAMLGANVTILDLSETQLRKDQEATAHYGYQVRTLQGDMRDLSVLADNSFDIVWHAHSLNFIPDAHTVFAEVARVLRPGGKYRLSCHNPYIHGMCEDDWNGEGYVLRLPYVEGEVQYAIPEWDVDTGDGTVKRIAGPKEFRHTLSTLMNGLIHEGFIILRVSEDRQQNPEAEPGTWDHFAYLTVPYIAFWLTYQPGNFRCHEKR
jgi:2-polyprenyl-3-methyl-5-hydroxy-6-metoxy-1,4-benzoquinol methylase